MHETKIKQFLAWLEDHGPANWAQIQSAGFKSIFNGATRKRLVSSGVILIERATNDAPRSGAHRQHNLYRLGGIPYTPNRSGRRPGYKLSAEARDQMMIRSAMTILKNHGYVIFPPGSEING